MASSGTFTSKRYGNSSVGPYLTLAWTQVSQSVANNTTTLDLTLRFHWSASIGYTFYSRTGSVQGNSYTYSGSVSGNSGSRVLRTQRVTISHNSNGARSVTLSGNITGLGLVYSGNRVNTMSVSGTANLNTIPRASTLSAFSFNAHLKNGTANQINYTIDRKSTGFRHQIQLRDGNTVVRTWDNQSSNGKSTLPLTASEVNTLLNRMRTSTTRSYTLRVATRSGNNGGWIGSAVSRNATARVHDDVKPSVGSVSLSQTGNPVTTHTLQGFSKIKANFTRSAGYGATITSSSIQVRRRSGGADSQTINSNNGTTPNPVSLHGVYEARGTTRDSRGRTNRTTWATITVTQYRAPTITNFSASRNGSTPTTVNISRATTHTVLGTSNNMTYTVQRRQGTGAWTNVSTGATGTITISPSSSTSASTGNSVTSSYDFRYVVTDKLGGRAESVQSVTTQRVVLDIHKNEGVGIGKIHEQGVLDVDGEAHFKGDLYVNAVNQSRLQSFSQVVNELGLQVSDSISFWQSLPQGRYFVSQSQIPNQPSQWGVMDHVTQSFGAGSDFNTIWYAQLADEIYRKWGNGNNNSSWQNLDGVSRGSNGNGNWVEHRSGLIMCWQRSPGNHTAATYTWNYPKKFVSEPVVNVSIRQNTSSSSYKGVTHGVSAVNSHAIIRKWSHGSMNYPFYLFAIGF